MEGRGKCRGKNGSLCFLLKIDLFVLWEVIKTAAMWFVLNVKCFKIVNMFYALNGNVPLYHLITGEKNHGWDWFSRREMNVREKMCYFEGILRGLITAFLEGHICQMQNHQDDQGTFQCFWKLIRHSHLFPGPTNLHPVNS